MYNKRKRRNRQTIGFDVYIVTYVLRQTAFRSSRDIFYSAEHIFAAEHVSAVQKCRSCIHILESLCRESLQKESLQYHECEKLRSVLLPLLRNLVCNISDEDVKNYCLNIHFSAKMQILLLL